MQRAGGRARTLPRLFVRCLLSPGRVLQPAALPVTHGDKHVWPCQLSHALRRDVGSQEMGEDERQLTNEFWGPQGFALGIIWSGQNHVPADFRIFAHPNPSAKTPLVASKRVISPLCSPCQAPTPWQPFNPLQSFHPRGAQPLQLGQTPGMSPLAPAGHGRHPKDKDPLGRGWPE